MSRLQVVFFAPYIDADDVGESFVAFKFAETLSHHVDLTVLSFQRDTQSPLKDCLPNAEVVTWPEPALLMKAERLNAMLKPGYPIVYFKVRKWLEGELKKGRKFDLAHQLMPQPPRYPCPFDGLGIPFIMGPVGGALRTPAGFVNEVGTAKWFTRLRVLDQMRVANDPWLRSSYRNASLILGVAPYVQEFLKPIGLKKFEVFLELGIDELPPLPEREPHNGLNLLHVGRGVRTKGLRDVVRAMAKLNDIPDLQLTSAGAGEEIAICQKEAQQLGIAERVRFLGKISRLAVEELYRESDVFVFPSFREPAGNVVYEAMRWGLPVIAANYGGPAYTVDDTNGIRLDVFSPKQLADDVAKSIRVLYQDSEKRLKYGIAGRERLRAEGLWKNKIEQLLTLYERTIAEA